VPTYDPPFPVELRVHAPKPKPPLSLVCQPSPYALFEALSRATVADMALWEKIAAAVQTKYLNDFIELTNGVWEF
jgi:hypothetical protein